MPTSKPSCGRRDEIDTAAATAIWDEALAADSHRQPVWVHGDVAVGNLLVEEGCLRAVIDFGSSAVGDPACDAVIAWTFFTGESRAVFHRELPVEPNAWTRSRGWALWKALITIAGHRETDPVKANEARRVLGQVVGG